MPTLSAPIRAVTLGLAVALLLIRAAPAQPAADLAGIHDSLHAVSTAKAGAVQPDPSPNPSEDTTKIGKVMSTVESFSDFLLKYFIALAAVGALAMAIIEFFKKIWEWRTRHYAKALTRWLGDDKDALAELLHLTTAMEKGQAAKRAAQLAEDGGSLPVWGAAYRDDSPLFALELDQMMGHVQDAVDVALNNPVPYGALYRFATRGASPEDIEAWKPIAMKPADPGITAVEAKTRADIYTRLHQIVKRRLDAFQLKTGRTWVNWNQFWANVVGFLVMLGCLGWLDSTGAWNQSWPIMIILSLMGGVLSPVAKDIVIALKKVRGG
jgi:hypothetical protein